jgi:hypothetical protein
LANALRIGSLGFKWQGARIYERSYREQTVEEGFEGSEAVTKEVEERFFLLKALLGRRV